MTTTNTTSPGGRSVRNFFRHYAEMIAVMVLGMLALGTPADHVTHLLGINTSGHHPATMIITMSATMTLPMVAWMRYRGHSWRANAEMAAAMVIPTLAAVGLLLTGVVTETMMLMTIEHAAMLACMLVAMLLRYDEYAAHGHVHHGSRQAVVA